MVSVAINLIIISLLIYFLYLKAQNNPLKPYFFPALIFKISAGVLLGLIYRFYYEGGDTFNFFHDAVIISEYAKRSPGGYCKFLLNIDGHEIPNGLIFSGQPRALFNSKILSIVSIFTGNNYWLTGIYLSLFSFAGMWYLGTKLTLKYPANKHAAAISLLFFPSVVFWSSGVMKESIIMGSLSFLCAYLIDNIPVVKKDLWKKSFLIFLFLILLWKLKYYYLAVFLAVSITTIFILFLKSKFLIFKRKQSLLYIIWFLFFIILLGASTRLYPTLEIDNIIFFLLDTHNTIYINSQAENLIHYNNLNEDFTSFLFNLPLALFSGLFRPGIWDVHSIIQVIPAIENLFILISSLLIFKNINENYSFKTKVLLLSALVYIFILAVLMAFAAPNFGTLMRYKVGFLPFLVYILCIKNPAFIFFKTFKNRGT